MKLISYFLLLFIFSAAAIGAETINEEASMPADGRVLVSNVNGSVEIEGWSKKRIEVTGKLGKDSVLTFDVDGDTARVEVEMEEKHWKKNYDNEATHLVIRVPQGARVSASTVSATLDVRKVKGMQRLKTVSGDLNTEVFAAETEARTVSGEIEIEGSDNTLNLTVGSVSGDIEANNISGEISAKTVSGDIELVSARVSRLRLNSVSGDIEWSGDLENGGRIDAETVSGDVVLKLRNLLDTEYSLQSFSGRIDPVLDVKASRTSKYAPGRRLELSEGSGASRVYVETMSGDIEVNGTGTI
ncbi:MAG: DUF4097 family beta strand repeat protein, partial [Gammaproteobacteria bacterium]|nr:DUF4097 family beta strand repeat protein [Gammaproteobacteria bacterium]